MYADGQTAVNVVVSAKIKGVILEHDLDLALLKIQARHPLLSVNVLEDENGIPCFVTQEPVQSIPVCVRNRYADEDWQREVMNECLFPFDAKTGPLIRLAWLKSDGISDLILTCHHCICDGKSILNLLDEILRLLGHPETEIGSYSSFSSIYDFIPDAIKYSKVNKILTFFVSKIAKVALLAVSSKKEVKRVKPYLIHWKLDQEESALLLEKCKIEGVSVHAVLCVAFLMAFGSAETFKSCAKLYCAVDMRRFLPEIKDDMLFAIPAMVGLCLKDDGTMDFWDQARLFKKDMLLKLGKMNISKVLMFSEGLMSSLPRINRYSKADTGAHDFTLSNMDHL